MPLRNLRDSCKIPYGRLNRQGVPKAPADCLLEANFTDDVVADLGHGLSLSRHLWEYGLPLNCSFPFYFDLFGPVCSHGFIL
ncbi:hypothetical protein L3X38_023789 [Prunus dulcis]|uniref:Uncharacterized protein n=1 Tax=Prunus dulcis TaxID=3755 RepID=A0AAD4W0H2_PRUDU|nr:hypothetical protein L3X38_023789 [Prunus dulcis]